MSEETHARLSPSGAHRWMLCAASAILEEGEPDTENEYAKEGTLAHALAAHCLTNKVDARSVLFLQHKGEAECITQQMANYVQEYLDYVRVRAEGHTLLIEQPLELEWLTGEKGAKGTADAVIVSRDGKTLDTVDLKYGMGVRVEAFENKQLRIYDLCAERQFDMLGDYNTINSTVHQPRLDHVDTESLSLAELRVFEAEVRAAVNRVEQARQSNSLEGFLHPGEEQCKFCKARHKCPALASLVSQETGADFDNVSSETLIEPVDPHKALVKAELIEIWIKGLRAKVEADLFSGKKSKYWKLVSGKKGNRDWVNEAEVEKEMRALKLSKDEMYNSSILTPAKLEKKLKKTKPKIWDKLSKFISQKQGGPSVAPLRDPRPEYTGAAASDDFEEVA